MANNASQNQVHKPAWLHDDLLIKAMRAHFGYTDADVVESISIENATKLPENYTSLLLRVEVAMCLSDGSKSTVSLILKTPHSDAQLAAMLERLQHFDKEADMYRFVLPRFEAIFKEAGNPVQFAPHAYQLSSVLSEHYVLMQDLRDSQYRIANRIKGLDLAHMHCALAKLAELHAASACYVEQFGNFEANFTVGIYKPENRDFLQHIVENSKFLSQLKTWKFGAEYYDKLVKYEPDALVNLMLVQQRVDPREFNVLNHGDLWTNNIMFQYDAFGKIKDTLLLDYPAAKYGSPALDLYYLILTSAASDIKLTQFDALVRYYYLCLVKALQLLHYQHPLPKLRNLHTALLNNGLTAYIVVSKLLPVSIYKAEEQPRGKWGTEMMYANPKYVQAMAEILPWLDNRGLLDW